MPTLRVAVDSSGAVGGFNALTTAALPAKLAAAGVAAALAAITAAGIKASRDMIRVAAAAEEIRSKFRAVFKGEAAEAEVRLNAIAAAAGRARIDLIDLGAGIQDILVPLGVSRDAAAQLSTQLARLAVDVGSFQNRTDSDVAERFQSALVGNSEAVRSLGINLSATSVEQEAFNLGLAKSKSELTEQDKVLARISLLFKNTSDAQGDAERTADSYENTMRRLRGTLKDTQAEVGLTLTESLRRGLTEVIGLDRASVSLERTLRAVGRAANFAIEEASLAVSSFLPDTPEFEREVLDSFLKRQQDAGRLTESEVARLQKRAQRALENVRPPDDPLNPIRRFGEGPAFSEDQLQIEALRKVRRDVEQRIDFRQMRELASELRGLGVSLKDIDESGAQTLEELRAAFPDESSAAEIKRNREELERIYSILERGKATTESATAEGGAGAANARDRERARREAERLADQEYLQRHRIALEGTHAAVQSFASGLGAVAAGFQSLEDAALSVWQNITFAIVRAAAEMAAFNALQSAGVSSQFLGALGFAPVGGGGAGGGVDWRSYPAPTNNFGVSPRQRRFA